MKSDELIKKGSDQEIFKDMSDQELDDLIVKWSEYLHCFLLYPSIQTMDTMRAECYLDMFHQEVKRREAA